MSNEHRIGFFVWHDLITTDIGKTTDFYCKLFPEWNIVEKEISPGMPYLQVEVDDQPICGWVTMDPSEHVPSHWIGYIQVDDCESSVEKAKSLGGSLLMDSCEVPDVCTFALISDPIGAAFQTIQMSKPPLTSVIPSVGHFCFNELLGQNIPQAVEFYKNLFGWNSLENDMGPMGIYTLFRIGEQDVAGALPMPEGVDAPSHWLSYIMVDDVDARTAKAEELGGKVCKEPTDIPDIGRFSVLLDSNQAVFALFKSAH